MANRKSLRRRTLSVEDPDRPGVFIKIGELKEWQGGGVAGENGIAPTADGGTQILGGDRVRENATAKIPYDEALHPLWDKLERGVLRSKVRVFDEPTDDRRVSWSGPRTLTGLLIKAQDPDSAWGNNEAADAEFEFALDVKAAPGAIA